jgi:hypothetical protein
MFGTASAHDYVEKIFQVPFWLKPMAEEDARRMVRGILKASLATKAAPAAAKGAEGPGAKSTEGLTTKATDVPAVQRADAPVARQLDQAGVLPTNVVPAQLNVPATLTNIGGPGSGLQEAEVAQQVEVVQEVTARTETDLAPESLEISAAEVEFMAELAPLLGRSPRTLKRFVNVYRLIKVGLSPYERHIFLNESATIPDYRAVLYLLAIDTGAPQLARAFFATLRDLGLGRALAPADESGLRRPYVATVENLIALLDEDDSVRDEPDWHRVRGLLERAPRRFRLPDDVSPLARWVPHVSRFSFHTGRI